MDTCYMLDKNILIAFPHHSVEDSGEEQTAISMLMENVQTTSLVAILDLASILPIISR
jgi:hypothetical protein